MSEQPKCELCGEPMPEGEEVFKFHGYSGACPKPPLPKPPTQRELIAGTLRDDARAMRELGIDSSVPENMEAAAEILAPQMTPNKRSTAKLCITPPPNPAQKPHNRTVSFTENALHDRVK